MIREKNRKSDAAADFPWPWDVTVCGIISNADDRVTSILSSLGLKVGPWTFNGPNLTRSSDAHLDEHIHFTVLSYDVGAPKPDKRMFGAAEQLCRSALVSERFPASSADSCHGDDRQDVPPLMNYTRLHVGNDMLLDVLAAESAGWNGILIDRKGQFAKRFNRKDVDIRTEKVKATSRSSFPSEIRVIQRLMALCHWRP
ncbi:MAG: hypothetical protein M1816_001569 [Peltula sp. TS41687]|nr:MAG: hypothetical protein M1816_001569 [Peltula sp. TS41687]